MNKKDIDKGYLIGDFYIVQKPIEEGYLHIINIKNEWQMKIKMGTNVSSFLTLPKQDIFDRINGIYIQSMMSLYDSDYSIEIAKHMSRYVSNKSKLISENNTENEDLSYLKKHELMSKLSILSEDEIMDMIINEEINYECFK